MPGRQGVFISYARSDGEAYATRLRQRLEREEPGLTLWQDRARMEGGKGWWSQISDALDVVQFMVLVMTTAALKSSVVRKEWHEARQRGVCVYPVVGSPDLNFDAMPGWMKKLHFYNLEREWQTFINHLKSPCILPRHPFMAPDLPKEFVRRNDVLTKMCSTALDDTNENPRPGTVALWGAGGFGKTTLAAALCHDDTVITAFDAGVLWVTLGEKPNVLAELTKLYIALTNDRRGFVDEEDAAIHLAEKMADHTYLIVLDDVWNIAHLRHFLHKGENCTRLVTTRQISVAIEMNQRIEVDEMPLREAVQLLLARLTPPPSNLSPFKTLAQRLGGWPLLLELANAALYLRVSQDDTAENALDYLNKAFDKRKAIAFDHNNPQGRNQAVTRSMGVSIDFLRTEERQRYLELAIFPEDVAIPLTTVSALWSLDDVDTGDLIARLNNLSLLKYDLPKATIRLHKIIRDYLASQLDDPVRCHARLLDGWGDLHVLPDVYAWRWVGYHLVTAGRTTQLQELLLKCNWLHKKLKATNANMLVADCERIANDSSLLHLGRALRQASYILAQSPEQLVGQLLGRLYDVDDHNLQLFLRHAVSSQRIPYLRPLTASLGEAESVIRTLAGHADAVHGVTVTANGSLAISASADQTLKVWEIASGQELCSLKGHAEIVNGVAVTPDGRFVISASDDKTLKVWDISGVVNLESASGREVRTLNGHAGSVNGVAVTSNGCLAISASADNTLKVWEIASGQELLTLEGHTHSVKGVAVTMDGRLAISASADNTLKVWDITSGRELRTLEGHTRSVNGVAVTLDGHFAISASADKTLKVWDITRGQELHSLEGHTISVFGVTVTADLTISAAADNKLKVWDISHCSKVVIVDSQRAPMPTQHWHGDSVNGLAMTGSSGLAISASTDGTLKVWDISGLLNAEPASVQGLHILAGHKGWISGVAVSKDGHLAVSASWDKTLKVWEIASGRELRTLKGHMSWVNGVAVTADSRFAISASRDKTLKVWDICSGQELYTFSGHTDAVKGLAVTQDSRFAISASADKTLKVWDISGLIDKRIDNSQELGTFKGHTDCVNEVVVTREGRFAISASTDRTLRIWEIATSQCLLTLEGHTSSVNGVAVTTDDHLVISVSDDTMLKVWDISQLCNGGMVNSQAIATLYIGEQIVTCAVASDSRTVIAGGRSGRMHFLQLENM